MNDYEIGKRFSLETVNIMNDDGTLNAAAGAYAGLDRFAGAALPGAALARAWVGRRACRLLWGLHICASSHTAGKDLGSDAAFHSLLRCAASSPPPAAARKQLWADMEEQGLVIKQEPYQAGGAGWGLQQAAACLRVAGRCGAPRAQPAHPGPQPRIRPCLDMLCYLERGSRQACCPGPCPCASL